MDSWIWILGAAWLWGAFCIWATNARWREKGEHGFPRMESGGKLYWVNRDDKPCFRCTPQPPTAQKGASDGT